MTDFTHWSAKGGPRTRHCWICLWMVRRGLPGRPIKGLVIGGARAEAGRGSTCDSARQSGDCECHRGQLGRDRRRSVVGRKWQWRGCHNATLSAARSQKTARSSWLPSLKGEFRLFFKKCDECILWAIRGHKPQNASFIKVRRRRRKFALKVIKASQPAIFYCDTQQVLLRRLWSGI